MKHPGMGRKHRKIGAVIALGVLLFFYAGGIAFSSGDGGHGGTKGWVETDTYRVMNFVVLAAGLFFLLKKPISQALDSRIRGIKEQLADLETKKEKVEQELTQYKEKLSLLDKEAEKIVEEYIRQGKEAKERILKEAEAAAQRLEEQAHRNIEQEFAQAKSKIRQDIFEKALAKAEEMVSTNITTNDHERLVDEYLGKVVA